MMHWRRLTLAIFAMAISALASFASAENIDPDEDGSQYAWGENVGWLNFEPGGNGSSYAVTVEDAGLTGYVWAENIGWVNLSPASYGGVFNDGTGLLSGYAWGENVGWINFGPAYGGVTIDLNGNFDGWAWGENVGWITTCIVDFDDLQKFCQQWLQTGPGLIADLDGSNSVDFIDYSILANEWFDYCPIGWPLK